MISIKKGIDLPISGRVENSEILKHTPQTTVAVLGEDYLGLKPTMMVAEGDIVKKGQPLFEDKKNRGVFFCAPMAGKVQTIARGERRKLLAVIIAPQGDEAVRYDGLDSGALDNLDPQTVRQRLQESGFWACLRKRPFSKIPAVDGDAYAVFVNAMDSNPLSFDPLLALDGREDDYHSGLAVLCKLTDGAVHVCHENGKVLPTSSLSRVKYHQFGGIHPAGLVGTHIHFIEPAGSQKEIWYLSLQDLLAIGHLFRSGELDYSRVVAVAGPGMKDPHLLRTVKGANLTEILNGHLHEGEQRIISGSVYAGRKAASPTDYLGAYDQQVVVLPEGRERFFLEFVRPGAKTYSRTRAYLGRFLRKTLPFTTSVQGSPRPIVPYGIYEEVMPLDILPTLLLKALIIKDTDTAVQLGALELDEEDIALLTYVDPGKHDFGAILRENLQQIEEEG